MSDVNHTTANEKRSEKFMILLTPTEIAEIDNWRYSNHIPSRSEAIRRLIALGLRASTTSPTESTAPKRR